MHGSGDICAVWEGYAVIGRKIEKIKGIKQYKSKVNTKEKEIIKRKLETRKGK